MSTVRAERHVRHNDRIKSLQEGDPVEVRFINLVSGVFGFVVTASPHMLRMKVHGPAGNLEVTYDREPRDCLNWDIDIPMTAVAWIRHSNIKPLECPCREDLP